MTAISRVPAAPVPDHAEQIMVRMRDGVRLATDLYLPEDLPAGAALPAVVVRLPYDKDSRREFLPQMATRFMARGYALVTQDVRGKFRSEGEAAPLIHELDDGYDTLEWIVRQAWSNGRVGAFGDSYYGFTQWAMVASGHPALKAIVPRHTGTGLGAPPPARADGAREIARTSDAEVMVSAWADREGLDFRVDWDLRPIADALTGIARAAGARTTPLDLVLLPERATLPVFRGRHPFDGNPIPVLHTAGWYDNLLALSMRDYLTLRARPAWAPLQYLVVNSVDHKGYHLDDAPITPDRDHTIDDAALERLLPDHLGPALDFFDVFLAERGDASALPRVKWHLAHDGWRVAESWPPPGTSTRTLHLSAGALAPEPPAVPSEASWVHDPADPVPSLVGNGYVFFLDYPDEAANGERDDVVSLTGAPVAEPLDLAGPVALTLTLSASGPTTDVFAKLLDLAPDGSARQIVRGQVLLPYELSEARTVDLELGHVGYRLRPGHSLRLHLASSDHPSYALNPGTGEDRWRARGGARTTQTLHLGGAAPGRLTLSVLELAT